MAVAYRDLTIPAGSAVEFVVDVVGGPASLSGYTGAMMIRALRTDTVPLATVPPSAITVNPTTRQVSVRIPGQETSNYHWARGVYDLVITGSGGEQWRLVEGRVICSQPVTRGV